MKLNLQQPITTILLSVAAIIFMMGLTSGIEARTAVAEVIDKVSKTSENQEILWFARIIYSETKYADEQVLIAWVVRNRVETEYTGDTYREVALSSGQFSGLNAFDAQYRHNMSRGFDSEGAAWKSALLVAESVYHADVSLRPFSKTVRHFYSPISVSNDPSWSAGLNATHIVRDPETRSVRFAFYDGVK